LLVRSELAHFSREAATAHSRGRQPTVTDQNRHPSREAAAADAFAVAASRLRANYAVFLRADARSYVLPSLRDSKLCNFNTGASGLYANRFTDDELKTVISLLAGPGVVWELGFGSWILLQPELINFHPRAVIRSLREQPLGLSVSEP
jgi:hypothetical protein